MQHARVLILDYGSQYTQLIARRIRALNVYSLIQPGTLSLEQVKKFNPSAIILSGGPNSVYDKDAPQLPEGFREWQERTAIPVLGICYGLQLLVQSHGGKVGKGDHREYGATDITTAKESVLFSHHREIQAKFIDLKKVWMSHGDEVLSLPPKWIQSATSSSGALAAAECSELKIYALQFHPEVTHTEEGTALLDQFLSLAHIKKDWIMGSVLEEQVSKIRAQVGESDHVICALSGGVDSTVAACLVHRALGDRLHCVFVDHGMLRWDEQARVMKMFKEDLHLPVECIDASEQFLKKLSGVSDPEKKRKIIGAEFIQVFKTAAQEIERSLGLKPKYLVQGTLYPDVIESSPAPTGGDTVVSHHAHTIKSHHNVGGLPKDIGFQLIEPFRELFKDEVRELGKLMQVPARFLERHPFPGPGLAVRIIGDITRERIEILQRADEIFIEALREYKIYNQIWQAFAVFLPIRSVGVQGDGRTHDHVIALRAVTSTDGMTADWYHFDTKFLAHVSTKITNEVKGINRVVYDITSKPPATIEWE